MVANRAAPVKGGQWELLPDAPLQEWGVPGVLQPPYGAGALTGSGGEL